MPRGHRSVTHQPHVRQNSGVRSMGFFIVRSASYWTVRSASFESFGQPVLNRSASQFWIVQWTTLELHGSWFRYVPDIVATMSSKTKEQQQQQQPHACPVIGNQVTACRKTRARWPWNQWSWVAAKPLINRGDRTCSLCEWQCLFLTNHQPWSTYIQTKSQQHERNLRNWP